MRLPDYKLTFDHPELEGLEVVIGRLTVEELFEFIDLGEMPTDERKDLFAYVDAFTAFLGKHMISWTLTDRDDVPVPLGQTRDMTVLRAIRDGLTAALNGGAAAPVDPTRQIEDQLPMQAASAPVNDALPEAAGS